MNRTCPVDLQTHSTFSDGTDTPEELVSKAAALGIRVLAVTDHDSVRGVAAARAAGAEAGVHVLPAIELSTAREEEEDFLDINILGYGIDPDDPTLLETLKEVIESRIEQKICQTKGFVRRSSRDSCSRWQTKCRNRGRLSSSLTARSSSSGRHWETHSRPSCVSRVRVASNSLWEGARAAISAASRRAPPAPHSRRGAG